jgi:predicted transposase YbfD/YdcC
MHCQRETATAIVDRGGDYLLALKGNQGDLYDSVTTAFSRAGSELQSHITVEKGHGRLERRESAVLAGPELLAYLKAAHHWPHLAGIGRVVATGTRDGAPYTAMRHYLLSKALTPEAFGTAVRSHWEVENKLHWSLDVIFHEDKSRTRLAAQNLARVRQLCLNSIARTPHRKTSLRTRRFLASSTQEYFLRVLREGALLDVPEPQGKTL